MIKAIYYELATIRAILREIRNILRGTDQKDIIESSGLTKEEFDRLILQWTESNSRKENKKAVPESPGDPESSRQAMF